MLMTLGHKIFQAQLKVWQGGDGQTDKYYQNLFSEAESSKSFNVLSSLSRYFTQNKPRQTHKDKK